MEILNICLSDIPKLKIVKSDKNKKLYIQVLVSKRKEKDQLGNDLFVAMSKTKEERAEKDSKTNFIGSGKTYNFEAVEEMAVASEQDLDNFFADNNCDYDDQLKSEFSEINQTV